MPSLFPGQAERRIMWRLAGQERLAAAARAVARGGYARPADLIEALDSAGVSAALAGGRWLPQAVVAFELAGVNAGAATTSLSCGLAHSLVQARGTPLQRETYARPGRRGALCVTEPLPYVGSETALLEGQVRLAEWKPDAEPLLQVDKRGRFTSHMDFADFVVAAVASRDERIRGSLMVMLEPADPGLFDRGAPVRKLAHRSSSTRDPVFRLRVPAGRILGGYEIADGAIIPRFSHGELLGSVMRGSRAVVGLMAAAKLLAAVRTVTSFQRGLRRPSPGWARLVAEIWAAAEAACSLGFAAVRSCDDAACPETAAVLSPAAKLWNTGQAAARLREAVSLLGAAGAAAGCPGQLNEMCFDAHLEAVYEGPEAIQRRQLSAAMVEPAFLARFRAWTAGRQPGAATLAPAMALWLRTLDHLRQAGLYRDVRQGVTFPMVDALCWLLAARAQLMDLAELASGGSARAAFRELARFQSARAAGEASRICALLAQAAASGPPPGFEQLRQAAEAGMTGALLARDRVARAVDTVSADPLQW